MNKSVGVVVGSGLAGLTVLTGCQSTSPCSAPAPITTQANCPPRPPLRQRLFGSVQKPGSCSTCPPLPPGAIPAGNLPPGAVPAGGPPIAGTQVPPQTIVGQAGYGPPPPGATLPVVPGPNSAPPQPAPVPGGSPLLNIQPSSPPPAPVSPAPALNGPSLGYSAPAPSSNSNSPQTNTQIVLGPPETKPVEKQATAKPTQPSVFPVDIPGYAVLAENIAAGQQPFPDGIQWLKQAGFDLAIHVRAPGEDDSADRSLFERAGLSFRSIELGADTFDQNAVQQIASEIRQRGSRPTFIYDRDGGRVGPLWVAYAVKVLNQSEASAREQAARLGFKPETRPEWAAALQRVLDSR